VPEEARLRFVHNVELPEVVDLMPHLGPEFIAAILKRKYEESDQDDLARTSLLEFAREFLSHSRGCRKTGQVVSGNKTSCLVLE
jgi:hypothetical protein